MPLEVSHLYTLASSCSHIKYLEKELRFPMEIRFHAPYTKWGMSESVKIQLKVTFFNLKTYYHHFVGHNGILQTKIEILANHRVKSHSFYCSDCIFGHFFCNYFNSNKNTVYVLGHKYSQTQFNPHLAARAKMTLSQAQNIFTPVNINCICFITRLHRTCTVSV